MKRQIENRIFLPLDLLNFLLVFQIKDKLRAEFLPLDLLNFSLGFNEETTESTKNFLPNFIRYQIKKYN